MADANALVTWLDVQQLLGFDGDEQTRTELLISAASGAANAYTGRLLASRAHTLICDGNGRQYILLPEYPVTALTKVFIDSDRVFAAASEVTDCIYYGETGELWREGGFPSARQNVKVTYTAGYTVTPGGTLPAEIKMAVIELIQWYRHRVEAESLGLRSVQSPDGTISQYEIDLPMSARRRLDPYRKVR